MRATQQTKALFRRALVVDDEGGLQLLVRALLEHEGFLVDVARDGIEACRRVRTNSYDAIICDIFMPNMDGAGFFRALCEIDRGQAARVLFVTGGEMDEAMSARVLESGRPILFKPFGVDEFTCAVGLVARSSREEE